MYSNFMRNSNFCLSPTSLCMYTQSPILWFWISMPRKRETLGWCHQASQAHSLTQPLTHTHKTMQDLSVHRADNQIIITMLAVDCDSHKVEWQTFCHSTWWECRHTGEQVDLLSSVSALGPRCAGCQGLWGHHTQTVSETCAQRFSTEIQLARALPVNFTVFHLNPPCPLPLTGHADHFTVAFLVHFCADFIMALLIRFSGLKRSVFIMLPPTTAYDRIFAFSLSRCAWALCSR